MSDVSGWWNLAVWDGHSTRVFLEEELDHAEAPWQFGYSTYGFLISSTVLNKLSGTGCDVLAITMITGSPHVVIMLVPCRMGVQLYESFELGYTFGLFKTFSVVFSLTMF